FHSITTKGYYYKEAAINARSPENEADEFERTFIEKMNRTPELNEHYEVRFINEIPYFIVLRRGEAMEESCLRCHSTPEAAPSDLVAYYGNERSFNRSLDEAVSAISIRIPLDKAYEKVNTLIFQISVLLGITLLLIFCFTIFFGKKWIFDPLNLICIKAMEISKDPKYLGDQIRLPSSLELSELTEAFNIMSFQLRQERDHLELRVSKRTEELHNSNLQLAQEINNHKKTITQLEETLKDIKTLHGLLPICMHCKNIRDDNGYWKQIESYIQEHSDAQFSHSVCRECAKKYYPDFDIYQD
ncbi:MAG: DUF3365 domain-containing protein, partial [Desulfamplus sp.]|nr:DUF3365 domain-containing protein [Desulfamplus sp.]